MKRMRRLLMLATALLLSGCAGKETKPEKKQEVSTGVFTNLTTDPVREEVKELMEEADLSNREEFFTWVEDYNGRMKADAGLVGDWTPEGEKEYAIDLLASYYDAVGDGTGDSNSRLTAMLLMDDLIQAEEREDYGTFIMMDMDQLENEKQFATLKSVMERYSAVFDEVSVKGIQDTDDFEAAYPRAWEERGVKFPDGKASMISVVMQDPYDEVAFIGHAGVLLEEEGYLLFIEKLAPTEPYQVTRLKDRAALKEELLEVRNYRAGDELYGPIVLENNKLLVVK